ncbi:hypothetical protein EYF80_025343 [Liparis tanakae]|uniref:Uncharacterized protein n=1 Tax=Liparis tanakae TaxID=230148 RepID=A0A4Z2HHH7_9TELE|nr:hypothetical protein EYF80_025343 [Liparis tanakae]
MYMDLNSRPLTVVLQMSMLYSELGSTEVRRGEEAKEGKEGKEGKGAERRSAMDVNTAGRSHDHDPRLLSQTGLSTAASLISSLRPFLNSKNTTADLCSCGVWSWESRLQTPEDGRTGGREDGLVLVLPSLTTVGPATRPRPPASWCWLSVGYRKRSKAWLLGGGGDAAARAFHCRLEVAVKAVKASLGRLLPEAQLESELKEFLLELLDFI